MLMYTRVTCFPPVACSRHVSKLLYEDGFAWGDDDSVIGSFLSSNLAFYATVSAIDLKFPPVGTRYKFNLVVTDIGDVYEGGITQEVWVGCPIVYRQEPRIVASMRRADG